MLTAYFTRPRIVISFVVRCLICLALSTGLGLSSMPARAQVPDCAFSANNIPVYFDPGSLAANGFDVDEFRSSMIDAMAVWNEESDSQYDLFYAGDTTVGSPTGGSIPPQSITVTHQDTWFCSDNALAKAFYNCAQDETIVRVILQDSCTMNVRDWRTGWSGAAGGFSYEGVMVHEFGHGIAFPDNTSNTSVMNGVYAFPVFLHLYDADRAGVVSVKGRTNRTQAVLPLDASSPTLVEGVFRVSYPSSVQTTFPVAAGSQSTASTPAFAYANGSGNVEIRRPTGSYTSGLPSTFPSPTTVGASGPLDVAHSATLTGEILAVEPTNCSRGNGCDIRWTSRESTGTVSTGVLADARTYSRPAVAVDMENQRFVLFYAARQSGTIIVRSRDLEGGPNSAWSAENDSGVTGMRYLGGAVFDDLANQPELGLLVAAKDEARGHYIYQYEIAYLGAGDYALTREEPLSASNRWTRRPFGIARDAASGRIVVAWRDTGSPRPITYAQKWSLDVGVGFIDTTFSSESANNGTDVTYDDVSEQFLIHVSR